MKRIGRFWPIALIAVVALGAFWFYQSQQTSKSTTAAGAGFTQIVDVKQGNLSSTLSVVGQLEAVQQADLSFERMKGTAKLLKLEVKAGNTVTAGQVLASIDAASYQQALDQARSDLQAAQEKLTTLKAPATALQTAKANLAVSQAQYNLLQAQDAWTNLATPDMAALESAVAGAQSAMASTQADLAAAKYDTATADSVAKLRDAEAKLAARYSTLAAENYPDNAYQDALRAALLKLQTAQDARITAEIGQQVAAMNLKVSARKNQKALADAQDALKTAQAGGDGLALAKAKAAVKDAEVALATAKDNQTTLLKGTPAATLAAAQADVDKKRLAVADAEADLAGTRLTAPFFGTVLQTKGTAGNQVGPSTVVLTLADLKTVQVAALVDETTIKRVSQGQTAQVTFDALVGQTLRGQVGEVPLQGALQGGVMVYEVPISLTGADKLPLLVGMTANVKIQTGQAQNALLVPAMAVLRSSSGYQVMVPHATDPQGALTAVIVEIGLSDGVNTVITKGLNLGDKVVVQLAATTTTTNNPFGGPGGFDGPPPGAGGGGGVKPGG
jgi:multidrug efflux pump subunit AcrA (membrane-fusion protein)